MFASVVQASLRFRYLVIAVAIALLVFGSGRLLQMPVDVFPEFAPPRIEIQTEGLGMTSSEVEELITIPLEDALRGAPDIDFIRSSSVQGLSQVVLYFKRGIDLIDARQGVQERLKLGISQLPGSAGRPHILQPLSSTSRVLKIGLRSDVYDTMELSLIAYWTIKFRLMAVEGVANIPIWGQRKKTFQVHLDPQKMRVYDVAVDQVMEATSQALDFGLLQYNQGAKNRIDGMIDTPNQRLDIHLKSPVFEPEHLARVPLGTTDASTPEISLDQIATLQWGTLPFIGDAVINDGEGLMMIVEKLPWANTLDVTRGVEAALEAMRPGLPDIEIDSRIFRPATFIELSMENLAEALLLGSLLVIVVLIAFLYEWRVALISVIAIPLSLVAGGLCLYLLDATINTMVLAGFVVAIGCVVDDAIIDVENITRRLREHRLSGSDKSTARIILEASLEVRQAIWHATLIIVLAVTPIFFMGGLSGAFFEPLALSFVLAMLASMVVAITVTPALSLLLLDRSGVERRQSPILPGLKRIYTAALAKVASRPRRLYVVTTVVLLTGLGMLPLLGQSLLPDFKERDFLMHWVPAEGTSHKETFRITQLASHELRAVPGVANFGAHIGRAIGGDEPYGVNFTENWVSVDPGVDYDETRSKIEHTVAGYPGLYRDVQTYLRERIKEVLTGTSESIVVRVFGDELPVLREQAERVREALHDIPGLIDFHVEQQVLIPQIQIKTRLTDAARHGVKPGDIRRAAALLVSGLEVSDVLNEGKIYGVWLWSAPDVRNDINDIRELPIDTPFGYRVSLADVADVEFVPTPNKIKRESNSRRIDIHGNVGGRDLGAVAEEVKRRLQKIDFPVGYYPQLLGEYKELEQARQGLLAASVLVVSMIFLILQMSLGNWRQAGLIFLVLPATIIGGVVAVLFADRIISLGALVGIITVLGIATRNGILLFQHFQHLERYENVVFGLPLVLRGASERLPPILMTSLCTAVALLPIIVPGSIPGHEIEHPMAVVILGGIVTSTLLTLFLLPVIYLQMGLRKPFKSNMKNIEPEEDYTPA